MRELEREIPTSETLARPGAELPALAIIGAGRVGPSIAAAARDAGLEASLAGRADALEACRSAEVALLCVPDAAIGAAAASISAAVPPLRFAGHTSGATGLEALAPFADAGAATFSLHPLQTVPDARTEFTASPCAVSGSDDEALALARALALRLGMRPFELADGDRAAYHAAASIASNFLVALTESAAALLERTGVAEAREVLTPLVLRTAANWSEGGAAALTGPISRGDEATIEAHLEAIRQTAPELLPLYEALAERTRAVAESRPSEDAQR